jgi:hypothetical protein
MQEAAGRVRGRHVAALGTWSLIATAALMPLQGVRWLGGLRIVTNEVVDKADGVVLADLTLVVAGLLGFVLLLVRRRLPLRLPKALAAGLGLMLVGGLIGLVAAEDVDSTKLLLRAVGVVALCGAAVWGSSPSTRQAGAAGAAFVGGAVASVIVGVVALGVDDGANRFTSGTGRAVGLAANATAFALVTALALALALVGALEAQRRRDQVVLGAASGLLGLGLLASGSRGATLAAAVVVALLCWRALRVGRRTFVGIVAAVAVLLLMLGVAGVAGVPTLDRLLERGGTVAGETSARSADVRFDQVGEEIERRGAHSLLVGSGLRDDEPTLADVRAGRLLDPHTAHLEVWLGLGLLGLMGWLLVAAATIVPGARLARGRAALPPAAVAVVATGAAYLVFVLAAFTANNVWNRYVWLLVAFSALLAGRTDDTARASSGTSRPSVGTWWRNSEWTSTVDAQADTTSADTSTT